MRNSFLGSISKAITSTTQASGWRGNTLQITSRSQRRSQLYMKFYNQRAASGATDEAFGVKNLSEAPPLPPARPPREPLNTFPAGRVLGKEAVTWPDDVVSVVVLAPSCDTSLGAFGGGGGPGS